MQLENAHGGSSEKLPRKQGQRCWRPPLALTLSFQVRPARTGMLASTSLMGLAALTFKPRFQSGTRKLGATAFICFHTQRATSCCMMCTLSLCAFVLQQQQCLIWCSCHHFAQTIVLAVCQYVPLPSLCAVLYFRQHPQQVG